MKGDKLHIVLDLQACQSPESGRRGIGRYSLALAKSMAAQSRGHRISLLLNAAMGESIEGLRVQFEGLVPECDIVVWQGIDHSSFLHEGNTFRWYASETARRDALLGLNPDVVHVASLFEGVADNVVGSLSKDDPWITAVTLYDLIPLAHQRTYLADKRIHQWYMEKIEHLKLANQLLGISQFSCEEAQQLLSIDGERLVDISGAADDIFTRLPDAESFRAELAARYGIRKPFIMYAGGFDSRKNIGSLILAYARLPVGLRENHQLVIVGGAPEPEKNALKRTMVECGLGHDDVVFSGFVPDVDLVKLYNLCALYVFASLQEGFGLPALEAMSSGAVVIGSNTSSLPEVIGMKEALVDPGDVDSIRAGMQMGLTDEGFRRRFIEHAAVQAGRFSWAESARKALEAMELAHVRDAGTGNALALGREHGKRTALLPAPGSKLPESLPGAIVFADKNCGGVSARHPLSRFAAEQRAGFDRVVLEVTNDAYCAKILQIAATGSADVIVSSSGIGRALSALAEMDRGLLLDMVYRWSGYSGLRRAIDADFDVDMLSELVPVDALDLLGKCQVVKRHAVDAAVVMPWRDRVDAAMADLRRHPSLATAGVQDLASLSASLAANQPRADARSRWFVDISNLAVHDAGTGIQRVVRHVLDELMDKPPVDRRVEPVYMDSNGVFHCAREYCGKRYFGGDILSGDDVVDMRQGDVFLGLDLAAHLIPAHIENFRSMRARGVKQYFVVYDLLPLLRQDCFEPHLLPLFRSWYEAVADVCDGVLCISRAVADEFESWLNQSRPARQRPISIGWFHLGADLAVVSRADGKANPHTHDLQALGEQPTFLMVGTIEPRKGHAQVLSAFERLWAQGMDVNLLIIGKPGWLVESLIERMRRHPMRGKRLFWFEKAGDDLLLAAYQCASALVNASEGEGFGLPLIEAAHHGVPLIVRDLPVFREIVGEHAVYFAGYDAESLASAVEHWIELDIEGRAPPSGEMSWLTWSAATAQLVDVVENNRWVHQWMPGEIRRFGAFDYRFNTQLGVGELQRGRMETTGKAGFFLYGPYVPLPAGAHLVKLHGKGKGDGWMDVCSSHGQQVHARADLHVVAEDGESSQSLLAQLEFVLERPVTNLEIRIVVDEGAELSLDSVVLVPSPGNQAEKFQGFS
ncbi:glycosyltransferase family 1 protein [Pseudoxanthomonas sp.]|uniref:glycosyltransferase family 4 protein n=1 Tax=Pseudoxanthomonas sp. TaxID=1871049 RepID=UPI00260C71E0|nr:glycosyltransferase family 1 protein [Pseudoxanthomonas sp.]WDS35637.1 MAG: glycosyltransferase family 1 protein [Pseudoxanthomonas sp.]